jgi:hypothetical protein
LNRLAKKKYNCASYREEMILLSLLRRLHDEGVSKEEKSLIKREVMALESEMGLETFTDNS